MYVYSKPQTLTPPPFFLWGKKRRNSPRLRDRRCTRHRNTGRCVREDTLNGAGVRDALCRTQKHGQMCNNYASFYLCVPNTVQDTQKHGQMRMPIYRYALLQQIFNREHINKRRRSTRHRNTGRCVCQQIFNREHINKRITGSTQKQGQMCMI